MNLPIYILLPLGSSVFQFFENISVNHFLSPFLFPPQFSLPHFNLQRILYLLSSSHQNITICHFSHLKSSFFMIFPASSSISYFSSARYPGPVTGNICRSLIHQSCCFTSTSTSSSTSFYCSAAWPFYHIFKWN